LTRLSRVLKRINGRIMYIVVAITAAVKKPTTDANSGLNIVKLSKTKATTCFEPRSDRSSTVKVDLSWGDPEIE
jgi:hypothetical protein